jgi:hypothetical protein
MNGYILPSRWCIKPSNSKEGDIIREWFKSHREYSYGSETGYYWHFPHYADDGTKQFCFTSAWKSYTIISFEQFQQYVLNIQPEQLNYQIY